MPYCLAVVFFFNDTATTEIYTTVHTLSLHDALPISVLPLAAGLKAAPLDHRPRNELRSEEHTSELQSRTVISYAVFCLKKKKNRHKQNKSFLYYITNKKKKQIIIK